MKGKASVIKLLNEALSMELTAINQYFIHSKMCDNWGYAKLAKIYYAESIDEMKHADTLMDRILFLDGVPNMQKYQKVMVGTTVREQLENDLKAESDSLKFYNRAVKACREASDSGSADVFEALVKEEEGHADWLEAQLHMVDEIGIENYLTQQMGE